MGKTPVFSLKTPETPLPLDGGLTSPVRLQTKLAMAPSSVLHFDSDFDGDGTRDSFTLNIRDGESRSLITRQNGQSYTLFLPGGKDAIVRIIPGDADGDRDADLLMELKDGRQLLLVNETPLQTSAAGREPYDIHLVRVSGLAKTDKFEAARASLYYNRGLTHTWVLTNAPEITTPATLIEPWLNSDVPYTDCYLETMRLLAELANKSGTHEEFSKLYQDVQFYDFNGTPEHTDFFTVEALPRMIEQGYLDDSTKSLYKKNHKKAAPTFPAIIDKEAWFRYVHKKSSGKDFPQWSVTLDYYPFAALLKIDRNGKILINPKLEEALPPLCILVVMNKDRKLPNSDITVPDSHIVFLMKDENGERQILHSTPTTDVGIASTTTETIDSFFRTRYANIRNSKTTFDKNKTAVGVKILTLK